MFFGVNRNWVAKLEHDGAKLLNPRNGAQSPGLFIFPINFFEIVNSWNLLLMEACLHGFPSAKAC